MDGFPFARPARPSTRSTPIAALHGNGTDAKARLHSTRAPGGGSSASDMGSIGFGVVATCKRRRDLAEAACEIDRLRCVTAAAMDPALGPGAADAMPSNSDNY